LRGSAITEIDSSYFRGGRDLIAIPLDLVRECFPSSQDMRLRWESTRKWHGKVGIGLGFPGPALLGRESGFVGECEFDPIFQVLFPGRVSAPHSLLGSALYGAVVAKVLIVRSTRFAPWVLPVAGGLLFSILLGLWLTSALWFFTAAPSAT